jgi:RimJ/RimL family protein N-acetyltransferase
MIELQSFNPQPILVGPSITLRPLLASDVESLFAAASDPLIWEQHPDPFRYLREAFEVRFFAPGLKAGSAFVVVDNHTNQIIGSSRYYDIDAVKNELAIGFTFLARTHWGGKTNQEMKSLMLEHAFQWADLVWLHIGTENMRSRKAAVKIGAQFSHESNKEINGVVYPTAFYKLARARINHAQHDTLTPLT